MSGTLYPQDWAPKDITCCSITAASGALTLAVNVEERTFSGADQQTSYHFFGNVAERAIRLYDYQDIRWHLYKL